MAGKRQSAFEAWVPKAAQQKVLELRTLGNLTADDHCLLDRLATYAVMRTDVWGKLPEEAKGSEDIIIGWAFSAAKFAAAYRPPRPRKKKELLQYLQKYPSIPNAESAAIRAEWLLEAMKATNEDARRSWPGNEQLTLDEALAFIERVGSFYRRLANETEALIASISIPKIRKKNAKNAPEVLFSRLLSDRFRTNFGQNLDPVVDALSAVVFDQEAGVGSPTIRSRRRSTPGAAHYIKKPK
jgi:hypothetical protein